MSNWSLFLIDFFAGGIAGCIAKTVCAPLERIKLLMQVESENKKLKKPYKSVLDCARRCIIEEGYLSLWRGNMVNLYRYFPTQALNFSFKGKFQRKFEFLRETSIWAQNILAGGCAGSATCFFVHPLDLMRTRIGVDLGRKAEERQFIGLKDATSKIYGMNGVRGLYQGFGISLFGIFIYRGLYFGIYDTGKVVFMSGRIALLLIWLIESVRNNFWARYVYAQFVVIFSETIRQCNSPPTIKLPVGHPEAEDDDAGCGGREELQEHAGLPAEGGLEGRAAGVDARELEQHHAVDRKQSVPGAVRRDPEVVRGLTGAELSDYSLININSMGSQERSKKRKHKKGKKASRSPSRSRSYDSKSSHRHHSTHKSRKKVVRPSHMPPQSKKSSHYSPSRDEREKSRKKKKEVVESPHVRNNSQEQKLSLASLDILKGFGVTPDMFNQMMEQSKQSNMSSMGSFPFVHQQIQMQFPNVTSAYKTNKNARNLKNLKSQFKQRLLVPFTYDTSMAIFEDELFQHYLPKEILNQLVKKPIQTIIKRVKEQKLEETHLSRLQKLLEEVDDITEKAVYDQNYFKEVKEAETVQRMSFYESLMEMSEAEGVDELISKNVLDEEIQKVLVDMQNKNEMTKMIEEEELNNHLEKEAYEIFKAIQEV